MLDVLFRAARRVVREERSADAELLHRLEKRRHEWEDLPAQVQRPVQVEREVLDVSQNRNVAHAHSASADQRWSATSLLVFLMNRISACPSAPSSGRCESRTMS